LLKTRILTALLIFPATLAAVFLAPSWLFRIIAAALLLTGGWEFRRLVQLSPTASLLLLALQALTIGGMMLGWSAVVSAALPILAVGCACWLPMFYRLHGYRAGAEPSGRYRTLGFLGAYAAIVSCWFALAWLHDRTGGPLVVFLLLLIIWAADVGAYFAGRALGRRKLAPSISPNKTWEGVYGGILLALAAAWLWADVIAGLALPTVELAVMAVVTTSTSVGGDLFISVLKRSVGLKDTGTLFPGHGGVLDRYDSLLAGAPFFALAYGLFGS
jgi:phosphatidate cytidylyltransferase